MQCVKLQTKSYRGVAQLVERVVWDHQAAGSNPVTPTMQGLEPIRAPGLLLFCLNECTRAHSTAVF